jgi:hypothetical protein
VISPARWEARPGVAKTRPSIQNAAAATSAMAGRAGARRSPTAAGRDSGRRKK